MFAILLEMNTHIHYHAKPDLDMIVKGWGLPEMKGSQRSLHPVLYIRKLRLNTDEATCLQTRGPLVKIWG